MKTYLALAIIGLSITSWALYERAERANMERDNAIAAKVAAEARITEMEIEAQTAEQNRREYLELLRANENEIDRLMSELAAKPERVFIRGACPAVPEATDTRGAAGEACELNAETRLAVREMERNFLLLRRDAGRIEAWVNLCHATILAWGKND